MKKLLVTAALLVVSLPLFAQAWTPKDMSTVYKKYEAYVQTFSKEELDILSIGQSAVNGSLEQIKNIKLYTEEGWLDQSSVDKIKNELEGIKEFYDRIKTTSPAVGSALGTWAVYQVVSVKDKAFIGSLDEVFMKIANEYKDSNLDLAYELAKTCKSFQSDYDSISAR